MAKKKEIPLTRCFDCGHAHLCQWGDDPLIAICKRTEERQVASTVFPCVFSTPRRGEPQIEHRPKRIAITDIYYD